MNVDMIQDGEVYSVVIDSRIVYSGDLSGAMELIYDHMIDGVNSIAA